MDNIILQKKKDLFFNALETGWTIRKNGEVYILKKKHGGEKKILDDKYLLRFLKENLNNKN